MLVAGAGERVSVRGMRYLSTFIIASLFVVACKSDKKDAPASSKPVESGSTEGKPAAPATPATPAEPELTAGEAAKMDRDPSDEEEKAKMVAEAAEELAKEQEAKGIPTAEAALKALADGTLDYAMIDPSSPVAYADFAAKPPIERASCGASKELKAIAAPLSTAFKNNSVHCRQLPTLLVRCHVSLAAPSDASPDRDELFFDYEIAMGEAHLRAFGKRHLSGTTEQREKMFAEHDAKLVALRKKPCADAHGH